DWPGLARAVRSKLLALREEDFATAAVLMGASPARVIGRHLLPSFTSHLIASATLSIPAMVLGETALSFLSLGLRPPVTSWGASLARARGPYGGARRNRAGGHPVARRGARPARRRAARRHAAEDRRLRDPADDPRRGAHEEPAGGHGDELQPGQGCRARPRAR